MASYSVIDAAVARARERIELAAHELLQHLDRVAGIEG